MSDHAFKDDVAAYLLGALDERERADLEHHMAECAECREELQWLRGAADALPRSVEQYEPPPRLRASLLAEIGGEGEGDRDRGPGLLRRLFSMPRRLTPGMAWAGAAAVLAIGVLGGYGLSQGLSGDEVRTISATAEGNAGGVLTVSGDGEDGAILRVTGLPQPTGGDVYQAWVQRGGTITPEPTFEVGEDGRGAVAVPEDLSGADAVMVTREERGGARAPTGAPVLTVGL